MLDLRQKLSSHFILGEAVKSQVALRHGVDNTPAEWVVPRLAGTALHILEPVRACYGPFSPSSWYRCQELNRLVGGKVNSQHLLGYAVDFEIAGISNLEVAEFIVQTLDFDEVVLEFWDGKNPNSGWVHASWRSIGNRRKFVKIGSE